MNIKELHKKFLHNELSPIDLLDSIYKKIEKDNLNDYITLSKNIAYQSAKESEKRYKEGKQISKLDGIPISIKDNIAVKNIRMTCASKILENYISPYNATISERILEHGGVIIGKTNMDEFAMGSSTETSYFGRVKNPICDNCVPGGSSGGSAVSVASEHAVLSIGSDTGGSVRQPASFCGVVGFKPSYGAISRYGLTAFSSSLDTIGLFANNSNDIKVFFNVLKGEDKNDSTMINIEKTEKKENVKIGFIENINGLNENIKTLYLNNIEKIKNNNIQTENIEVKYFEKSISVYQILSMCEASSNLARFDGIKYGFQVDKANTLEDIYREIRGKGFGKEVKRRIMTGTYFLSYENAYYYNLSLKLRKHLAFEIDKIFENIDFIIIPTSLTLPFKFGEKLDDPIQMHLSDSLTAFCNLANLPSISINGGYINNLPVGIQIVGKRFKDNDLLNFAKTIEEIWSEK